MTPDRPPSLSKGKTQFTLYMFRDTWPCSSQGSESSRYF